MKLVKVFPCGCQIGWIAGQMEAEPCSEAHYKRLMEILLVPA